MVKRGWVGFLLFVKERAFLRHGRRNGQEENIVRATGSQLETANQCAFCCSICRVLLLEFAFSIVNMSLATVSKLFMLRSVKVQWAWLAYSLSHVVIGMIVTVCQRALAAPGNTVFWSHMVC